MQVRYTKRFLKDLCKIPMPQRAFIETLVFVDLPKHQNIRSIPNVRKLSIHPYYRVRLGYYRIGFEKEADGILLRRVLSRKEIYKFFP